MSFYSRSLSALLAYGTNVSTVRLWDLGGRHDVLVLEDFPRYIARLCFTADSHKLCVIDASSDRHVWNATPVPELWGYRQECSLVDELTRELGLKSEVESRIRSEPGLSDRVRKHAFQLVQEYEEGAQALNGLSWDVVDKAGGSAAAYELALRQARRACDLVSGDAMLVNTLGVALYRTGNYQEALAVLEKSQALKPEKDRATASEDLAYLAMTCWRLGLKERACGYLEQLRKVPLPGTNSLREVETLIEGTTR